MEILTWNIMHGGSKKRYKHIMQNLIQHNPEVIVVTEYREKIGSPLRYELEQAGWKYQDSSKPQTKENGILIASKEKFNIVDSKNMPAAKQRWIELYLESRDLEILAIHIPGIKDKWGKRNFWEAVNEFALKNKDKRALIIGDFNTGLAIDAEATPFALSKYMEELINMEWIDSWRYLHKDSKEFTWYSNNGKGFRLDYAFISPMLKNKLISASLSHLERQQRFSDHSSLTVRLDC